MKSTVARRNVYIGLTLILSAALLLRFWGIWFGLPFSFRADEYHEVFRALELGTGNFNFDRAGKGGYFYLLFVEYGVIFVALKLAGIIDSAQDFAKYFVRDPSIFYLVGRATTAVVGTLNVFLAYRLGARAYGLGAGVLAALFLTVDFLSAEHSHFITVDMPMTCLATAALLFAVRMVTEGKDSDYMLAGLFAALATTTKLPAVLLLVPLLVAHCYAVGRRGGGVRGLFLSRALWWAAGIFTIVLGVTNPGLVLDPPVELLGGGGDPEEVLQEHVGEIAPVVAPNLYFYYFRIIADSMGWPLFAVSIAGLVYGLWKRTPTDVILISFAAVYYVVFASVESHLYFPRYILPIIVVLALLAGRVLLVAWPRSGAIKQAAAIALVAILCAFPAYKTVANDYLLTQTDTRTLAKEWFDENIPQGSKVMIEGVKIEPTRLTIPLQDTPENMQGHIDYYKTREPGKATYLRYVLQIEGRTTYDLELVKGSDLQDLDFYKSKEVQYFVIRPDTFASSRAMGSAGRVLLDELQNDPEVRLLKSFRSDPRSRPGPDIDVYEVCPDAKGASRC